MTNKYELAPWMKTAESYIGTKEYVGSSRHNPVVVAFFAKAGHPEIKDDETAWCSAFANAVMFENGYEGTKNLLARSWLKWVNGEAPSTPRFGDIAIFQRGNDPVFGHVAFFVKWDSEWIWVLGGNQSNSVSITKIARSKLLGFRRPKTVPKKGPKVPEMTQKPSKVPEMSVEEVVVAGSGGVAAIGTTANGSPLVGLFLFVLLLGVAGFLIWKRS